MCYSFFIIIHTFDLYDLRLCFLLFVILMLPLLAALLLDYFEKKKISTDWPPGQMKDWKISGYLSDWKVEGRKVGSNVDILPT